MFYVDKGGSFPPGRRDFWIGDMSPMEDSPDPALPVQNGWRADQYEFTFHEADVFDDGEEIPTSS